MFVNTGTPGDYLSVDARSLAAAHSLPPVAANLILLGFAAGRGGLFAGPDLLAEMIAAKTPGRFREASLRAFALGLAAAADGNLLLNGWTLLIVLKLFLFPPFLKGGRGDFIT